MSCALITGGSGGIGLALAREFAAAGWSVVLVARNEAALATAAAELRGQYVVADLTRREAPQEIFDEVSRRGIQIDALVNNAGFGMYGLFAGSHCDVQLEMVDLNVSALIHLTHLFLPGMVERKNGKILNVSSTAGFLPGPLMAVYYATKAFVTSFSVAISNELEGMGVTVTALCPGATATKFAARAEMGNSRLFKLKVASAEEAARVGFRALMKGKTVAIVGTSNAIGVTIARMSPLRAAAKIARRMQERD